MKNIKIKNIQEYINSMRENYEINFEKSYIGKIEKSEILDDTLESLGLDSLDTSELIIGLEIKLEVTIPSDIDINNQTTINQLVEKINKKMGSQ